MHTMYTNLVGYSSKNYNNTTTLVEYLFMHTMYTNLVVLLREYELKNNPPGVNTDATTY